MSRRLTKDMEHKMLFGVASGIAKTYDIDVVLVRALFVVTAFFSGIGLILYIVLAILMPEDDSTNAHVVDVPPTKDDHEDHTGHNHS